MVRQVAINLKKQPVGVNTVGIDLNKDGDSGINLDKIGIILDKDDFVKPDKNPIFDFLKNNAQFIRDNLYLFFAFTTDVQDGLVPIGFDFWATPGDPISPFNCDAYPDSPYCGGNPLSIQSVADLITQLANLNISIVVDACNIGIQFAPVVGYILLPQFQIVYRDPDCPVKRPDPDPPILDDGDKFYPSPVTGKDEIYLVKTTSTHQSLFGVNYPETYRERVDLPDGSEVRIYGTTRDVTVTETCYMLVVAPIRGFVVRRGGIFCLCEGRATTTVDDFDNGYIKEIIKYDEIQYGEGEYLIANSVGRRSIFDDYDEFIDKYEAKFGSKFPIAPHATGGHQTLYYAIRAFDDNRAPYYGVVTRDLPYNWSIDSITLFNADYISPRPPLPPPPLPPIIPDPPMACCPEHTQLLRILISKVDKLSEIVGVDDYPASLPASFITKDEGFLGNLIPDPNVEVPSLTRFFSWYVERFDEVVGQFEIPIEVKDGDPTTPGDQPVGFKLPNIAETFGEMFPLLLQISMNTEALVNMNTRELIEIAQDKQQNFKSYMLVLAIADYLGFSYEEKSHMLPMLINIGKENLDEFLQNSESNVVAAEYTDKSNFQRSLHDLLQAAATIKAAHYRSLDIKGDLSRQIVDLVKGYSNTNKKINDDSDENFSQFLEDAEKGFTNASGITDAERPYGRDFNQRPRIREIGQDDNNNNP